MKKSLQEIIRRTRGRGTGAGDDVLLIDAADQQANIHAGEGFDMVQVVGSQGVTFNLAQAGAEIAIGNMGNDIFIGGGRSSVFVRGNDGDDIIIGGGANDALSGENGNDLDWQGDAPHITTIGDVAGRMRRVANDEAGRMAA